MENAGKRGECIQTGNVFTMEFQSLGEQTSYQVFSICNREGVGVGSCALTAAGCYKQNQGIVAVAFTLRAVGSQKQHELVYNLVIANDNIKFHLEEFYFFNLDYEQATMVIPSDFQHGLPTVVVHDLIVRLELDTIRFSPVDQNVIRYLILVVDLTQVIQTD